MINGFVTNPNNPRQPILEKAILRIAVLLVVSLALLAASIDRAFDNAFRSDVVASL